ncbi:MAG: dimethyl sulfoxide reductase anchor subunit [Rhodospirillales bacterium]|nr:dimethyl sulfoxide reductase anchor subunit [Rhodospirillales bacterium]
MHPALSVIAFTSLSGAGYGLLFLLSLGSLLQFSWGADRLVLGIGIALALGLIVLGLLASTQHLRRPERAWRAFSQWRSSWLSREGVLAVFTFLPAGLLFLTRPLLDSAGWFPLACALLAAAGAAATVFATAMIYASLKTVRQWHRPKVPFLYLLMGLATGGAFLALLLSFEVGGSGASYVAAGLVALTWLVKRSYWHDIDSAAPVATLESAIGLGRIGKVRSLEPPHTGQNYLLAEMGYRVARKHAAKLRLIAQGLGLAAVVMLAIAASIGPGWGHFIFALPAASAALASAAAERWLFFAEATHSVSLYYGKAA